jgi:hypothetical protein
MILFKRVLELADQAGLIEWESVPGNPECRTPEHTSV